MAKIIVSVDATDEKKAAIAKRVADALGVPAEDVVVLPAGVSVSVVDVPAAPKAAEHHAARSHAKSKE